MTSGSAGGGRSREWSKTLAAASETGWIGLFGLNALLVWPISRGLFFGFRYKRDPRGDILLGGSVALFVLALHGLYEWVFFMSYGQYMAAITMGVMAGLIRQMQREKSRRPVGAPSNASQEAGGVIPRAVSV